MRQQSVARTVSTDIDTSVYLPQSDRTSAIHDAQEDVITRVVQRIPQLIATSKNETATTGEDDQEILKVIKMPRFVKLEKSGESFAAVQEWEGVVTEIHPEVFLADLVDITAEAREANELAEISIEDIQEHDRRLFRIGAIFRWVVGYHRSAGGTKTRGSRIHFRRPLRLEPEIKMPELVFEDRPSG